MSTSRASCCRCIRAETGWPCHSLAYRGMCLSLRENALDIASQTRALAGGRSVFAVTHSMGALVLRYISSLPDAGALCACKACPGALHAVSRWLG
jgi:hypothetical protein